MAMLRLLWQRRLEPLEQGVRARILRDIDQQFFRQGRQRAVLNFARRQLGSYEVCGRGLRKGKHLALHIGSPEFALDFGHGGLVGVRGGGFGHGADEVASGSSDFAAEGLEMAGLYRPEGLASSCICRLRNGEEAYSYAGAQDGTIVVTDG